jgi:Flp pilus assembly pilin Flp
MEAHDNPQRDPAGRLRGDEGSSVVEYAMLIALILVVCLGVLQSFGHTNGGLVNGSASTISSATGP